MINFACRHYKASRPCVFNKRDGSECPTCTHASEYHDRILIVKLDAIGDVLRSASLLPVIAKHHHAPYIAWITRPESVELVGMMRGVDEVIQLSDAGMARIATGGWHTVYSLSNDMTSASIATVAGAKNPVIGYGLSNGVIAPSNDAARHWLEMAAFDRLKRLNTESYQTLMLRILGEDGANVLPPPLDIPAPLAAAAAARVAALYPGSTRRKVAVNVGSGGRWPKKMLDTSQIVQFIRTLLARRDVDVMLVGGAAEAGKTQTILQAFTAEPRVQSALTERSIPEFVALLAQAHAMFCGDTLALHIATAVGLPTVAIFGPTSLAEIPSFDGLVARVATPELDCLVCYGDCAKTQNCMTLLNIDDLVAQTIAKLPG